MPAYCASCGVDTLWAHPTCLQPQLLGRLPRQPTRLRIPADPCYNCWHSIAICHTAASASAPAVAHAMTAAQPAAATTLNMLIPLPNGAGWDIIVGAKATPLKSYKFNCIQCGTALHYGPGLCDWCPTCKAAR